MYFSFHNTLQRKRVAYLLELFLTGVSCCSNGREKRCAWISRGNILIAIQYLYQFKSVVNQCTFLYCGKIKTINLCYYFSVQILSFNKLYMGFFRICTFIQTFLIEYTFILSHFLSLLTVLSPNIQVLTTQSMLHPQYSIHIKHL